ncbi:MAG: STAS domain-containing protein [Marinilabiliaceae bacterium]|nr:STAS domain-containing protein [Marinilabiliaceae bacterium]
MSPAAYSVNVLKGTTFNTIELNGSLIINHIENIYNELNGKIDFAKKHIVELKEVDGIDLTIVQLLLSLRKEFINYGTDFEIKLDVTDEQRQLLKNSGFDSQFQN